MSMHHNGDKIGTLVMSTHQEVQMVSCTVLQKGKGKGQGGSFNGICYNCGKSGHSAKFCYAKGGKAKGKGKKEDSKGWSDSKG